ncbi:MAG: hypothetical protein AABX11_01855 [Nanoarchaeota archaeon]
MINEKPNIELFPNGAIVLLEDDPSTRKAFSFCLEMTFSNYNIIANCGEENCIDNILVSSGGLEKIAVVITDGNLGGGRWGWDIAEELRHKGYRNPIVYYGATILPTEKECLFDHKSAKSVDLLLELLRRYLK